MLAFSKCRVLIADDEPSMRVTLADILADDGFVVNTAADGLTAVEMCQRETYDVVLMDLRMPGLDGIEASRRIRETLTDVRVILMSAYGEAHLKRQAIQEGAIAFLDKPLNLETVSKLINDAIGISILAVTGDDDLADKLPACIQSSDEILTIVRSTVEAEELIRQLDFDVVLIDSQLPQGNGLDCYLALRKISPTITAIMVSSADKDLFERAQEAVRRTAYTVVTKPLQTDSLVTMITRLKAQRLSGSVHKPDLDL